eukprot:6434867-Amphidinium_carterae.1
MAVFETHLGSKVNAIPVHQWHSPFPIVTPSAVDGMFSGVASLEPKTMRAKLGRGMGIDGIDPRIAHVLPDTWLSCLPGLIENSYAQNHVVATDLTLQRLRPIPKMRKRRLTVKDFRGIAVSGFPRMMMTMVLLHSLGQYLTHVCPFSFAYVPNRGAQGLQLVLSQATTLMRKWYGEVTVLKTDIASAFDVVPWERIFGALCKKGVPEDMAHLVIHTQMSGYVLQWHGEQSEVVFMPTRGTRQGCKLGPVLYRIVVEE